MWLTLAVAGWFALPGAIPAAPAPAPAPQGAIADALRLLGLLPATGPLQVRTAVMGKEVVELERFGLVPVRMQQTVTRMVPIAEEVTQAIRRPDGKLVEVKRTIVKYIPQQATVEVTVMQQGGKPEKVPVPVKSCKFFVVNKDGRLEAVDAARAATLLEKRMAVLTGASTEVDPRHLELIKPGTLYLAVPPLPPPRPTMPPAPQPEDKRG
jgi:hypothetical protein